MARINDHAFHNFMAACQELQVDDVKSYHDSLQESTVGAAPPQPSGGLLVIQDDAPAVADDSVPVTVDAEKAATALKWATKIHDDSIIRALAADLPAAVQEEQIRHYEAQEQNALVAATPQSRALVVYPHLLKSRKELAGAFHGFLLDLGWRPGQRKPRNSASAFIKQLKWSKPPAKSQQLRVIRTWHRNYGKKAYGEQVVLKGKRGKGRAVVQIPNHSRRRESINQGRARSAAWLRQALYEWFASIRYSVDWRAVSEGIVPQLRHKCIGRFTRAMVKAKAQQLLKVYLRECLLRGAKAEGVQLRSRWFREWEAEYGLNMKKPNRKYKVPRAVMATRLEIGWLNVARVRALCLHCHGYEPDLENWDQTPFHNNEGGSQGIATLAVAGGTVPLIEGHAECRERWSANLTTCSNKERLLADGRPPYCEFMFKASAERLELKLREHLRSRGWGSWLSVATSEKGSYRLNDVLNFLETHLPAMSESRRWRIIMADDHSPHLSEHVVRLCWSRGYVFILHGGGVTPVVQTVDTDLNQHVKREYLAKEGVELIRQMQDGAVVPSCRQTTCIDLMAEVLSSMELHVAAAAGYVKTGFLANLDSSEGDNFIVREAGKFWKELDMRSKMTSAVAEVRAEAKANRLTWSFADVRRLIQPYPKNKQVDDVLAALNEDAGGGLEEGEEAWASENEIGNENDGDGSGSGDDHDAGDDGDHDAGDDGKCDGDTGGCSVGVGSPGPADDDCESLAEGLGKVMDAAGAAVAAESVVQSRRTIAAFQSAVQTLKDVGAMSAVVSLEAEIRKEEKRMRRSSGENPEVLRALARHMDAEAAEARERKRKVNEANAQTLSAAKLKKEIKEANEKLKQTKKAIADAESLLETSYALKTFSLEDLRGGEKVRSAAAARNQRLEVLDRLSRIGHGLSPQQRNDWAWFKNHWDAKMSEEHGAVWADAFCGWMQNVINEFHDGRLNAFSVFVHNETVRCFADTLALHVPGCAE